MAHLLCALIFPFKAKNFMSDYSKTAHMVELTVVLVLGISLTAIVYGTSIGEYQFGIFPPFVCAAGINVSFYTFALPLQIYATIGMAMLILAFSFVHRVRKFNFFHVYRYS